MESLFDSVRFSGYSLPEIYQRNGSECFLDSIRKKLIVVTPEEIIRQRMVHFLHKEMNVPYEMIELEVPLSYFSKGAKGRADIIVYNTIETDYIPVLIVECKAPHIPLTDDVFNQVVRYDNVLSANTIMLTNGYEFYIYSWNDEEHCYFPLKSLPLYDELGSRQNLEFNFEQPTEWIRPTKDELKSVELFDKFMNLNWIGEDTPEFLKLFLLDLACFIRDTSGTLNSQQSYGLKVISDGGIRYTTFGNAAGGNWGEYRYFILEDNEGNNQIVSITVLGSLKCVDHPVFGTRKGTTTLIVAIDDYEISHNSIQLNLDKYITVEDNRYTIWHDGTLTKGKQGAVRKSDVLEFVCKRAPELMSSDGNKIILGVFDNSVGITWGTQNSNEFILRLLKYAIIRDEYRKLK